jgi:uncharacterized membrane protein YagU involved in acid resistance
MSLLMLAWHRLLPRREQYPLPPEQIAARVGGEIVPVLASEREPRRVTAGLLHFGFGAATGAIYGLAAERVPLPAAAKGIAFGMLVWSSSYLGWLPALGILSAATEHPAGRNALMIGAHVVWGATLGVLTERLAGRRAAA